MGLLAADYDSRLIVEWFSKWTYPAVTRQDLYYHRGKFKAEIDEIRKQRHSEAINSGLALKEERVARLKAHADELERLKWVPDFYGKFTNEKVWRETLKQIAEEMGNAGNSTGKGQGSSGGPADGIFKGAMVTVYMPSNDRDTNGDQAPAGTAGEVP